MEAYHAFARAAGGGKFFRSDDDAYDLVETLRRTFGPSLIAYCLMPSHVHVIAPGTRDAVRRALIAARAAYAVVFGRRWSFLGEGALNGPVELVSIRTPYELARTVRYVHANPIDPRHELVDDPVEWEWSSARAYAGLARDPGVDVERHVAAADVYASWMCEDATVRADLAPAPFPTAPPEVILAAAAQTFCVDPRELQGAGRDPRLVVARAVYVRLALLERHEQQNLGGVLRRKKSQISKLARVATPDEDVRIARTLLRTPGLRARLEHTVRRIVRALALPESASPERIVGASGRSGRATAPRDPATGKFRKAPPDGMVQ